MSAHTDPGYCPEHRMMLDACEWQRHSWDTDAGYALRLESLTSGQGVHPCPSCRCAHPGLTIQNTHFPLVSS